MIGGANLKFNYVYLLLPFISIIVTILLAYVFKFYDDAEYLRTVRLGGGKGFNRISMRGGKAINRVHGNILGLSAVILIAGGLFTTVVNMFNDNINYGITMSLYDNSLSLVLLGIVSIIIGIILAIIRLTYGKIVYNVESATENTEFVKGYILPLSVLSGASVLLVLLQTKF